MGGMGKIKGSKLRRKVSEAWTQTIPNNKIQESSTSGGTTFGGIGITLDTGPAGSVEIDKG